jgi:hypothetical protein
MNSKMNNEAALNRCQLCDRNPDEFAPLFTLRDRRGAIVADRFLCRDCRIAADADELSLEHRSKADTIEALRRHEAVADVTQNKGRLVVYLAAGWWWESPRSGDCFPTFRAADALEALDVLADDDQVYQLER